MDLMMEQERPLFRQHAAPVFRNLNRAGMSVHLLECPEEKAIAQGKIAARYPKWQTFYA